ncbi:unnamed protein product [Parnassius apollo]|uniref:(apollo) hypothetical protein n=1 Tax=Parnassius apollo TaxID=110799 RepID=A0A8S3WE57_PARAO|nr:unnamed protein product [Parnassius apollo]
MILVGDFNINLLKKDDSKTKLLLSFLNYTRLSQVISEPTHYTYHSETLIDLVYSDISVSNTTVSHIPQLGQQAVISLQFLIEKDKFITLKEDDVNGLFAAHAAKLGPQDDSIKTTEIVKDNERNKSPLEKSTGTKKMNQDPATLRHTTNPEVGVVQMESRKEVLHTTLKSSGKVSPVMIPNEYLYEDQEIQEAIQEPLEEIEAENLQEIPEDLPDAVTDEDVNSSQVASAASLTSTDVEDENDQ